MNSFLVPYLWSLGTVAWMWQDITDYKDKNLSAGRWAFIVVCNILWPIAIPIAMVLSVVLPVVFGKKWTDDNFPTK